MAGFASESELAARLAAADFHLIALRTGWEGIVVPSKFFGALAMGRPVIYAGAPQSNITQWIQEHRLGHILDENIIATLEAELAAPLAERDAQNRNAHAVYQRHFSRQRQLAALLAVLPQ